MWQQPLPPRFKNFGGERKPSLIVRVYRGREYSFSSKLSPLDREEKTVGSIWEINDFLYRKESGLPYPREYEKKYPVHVGN